MTEIVKSVNSLCKLLNCFIYFRPSLKPEFFRLSKLNKLRLEERLQFWDILHRLCCFSTSGSCQNNSVKCVTNYMLTQRRVAAYFLPPDATPRQLLLCFGWLLSRGVIESIINKVILETPLAYELPHVSDESVRPDTVTRPLLQNDSEDLINYATYLLGLIQHNLRAISNYRQERAHLLAKVHKATAGIHGLVHLSAGDLGLLSLPELVPDFVSKCQHCLPILQAYSKWHKESIVFWEWMDSILLEEKSLSLDKNLSEEEKCNLIDFSKTLESNIRTEARMENENFFQEEFEFLTTRRMQLCESGKFLEDNTHLLDSKIKILNNVNERKKKELEIKLSSSKLNKKAEEVSKIFNQFNVILQNLKLSSATQLSLSASPAISKLSLDRQEGT